MFCSVEGILDLTERPYKVSLFSLTSYTCIWVICIVWGYTESMVVVLCRCCWQSYMASAHHCYTRSSPVPRVMPSPWLPDQITLCYNFKSIMTQCPAWMWGCCMLELLMVWCPTSSPCKSTGKSTASVLYFRGKKLKCYHIVSLLKIKAYNLQYWEKCLGIRLNIYWTEVMIFHGNYQWLDIQI